MGDDEVAGYYAEASRALHELFVNEGVEGHPTRRHDPDVPDMLQAYWHMAEGVIERIKRFVLTDGVEKVIDTLNRNDEVLCTQWTGYRLLTRVAFMPRVKADLSDFGILPLIFESCRRHDNVPA